MPHLHEEEWQKLEAENVRLEERIRVLTGALEEIRRIYLEEIGTTPQDYYQIAGAALAGTTPTPT